jgi:myo-inositol-1(or 4)-monophosphatase
VTLATTDLEQLAAEAARILTDTEAEFLAGLGAAEEVMKGAKDYATAVDLALERRIEAALLERTGLPVHGEEYGGVDLSTGSAWVLDPVDGTVNFSNRIPLAGTNLALVVDGVPLLGLTWLPVLGERYEAVSGGPVRRNGVELPALAPAALRDTVFACGHVSTGDTRYPAAYRLAVLGVLSQRSLRLRILGSSALELAWAASGLFGACVSFGNKPWDTAAGACLVRAAGGVVTDISGAPHDLRSPSMLAARPGVAEELRGILDELGDPSAY